MSLLLRLAYVFFKIGLLTFGGGYAMLPLIQDELVRSGWMTPAQFANILGVAETTPGALSINAATYVGYEQAGLAGALVASVSLALPSLTAVVLLAGFFRTLRDGAAGKAVFGTLRPVVAGLVVSAAIGLLLAGVWPASADPAAGRFATPPDARAVLLAGAAFLAAAHTRLHPALLVLLCGAVGLVLFRG